MGWLERQFGKECSNQYLQNDQEKNQNRSAEHQMRPGLGGDYDWELREKASMHIPPPPPEFMGLEGEYDEHGLAKRVALALDREATLEDLDTIEIDQDGGTVIFKGTIPDHATLTQITQIARKVDGAKLIDARQVTVTAG